MNHFLTDHFSARTVAKGFRKPADCLRVVFLVLSCGFSAAAGLADDGWNAGLLYDQFPLTLNVGQRTEAAGPLFYSELKDSEKTWALPPFFSSYANPDVEMREYDFLYPLLTYEYYDQEYRWQFCQLLSFSGGRNPQATQEHRFTIFPLYFQQRSPIPQDNYTALVPIYGHLQHRLFRDKSFFVMFPFYGQTQKKDVVTDNYLWPFFHLRHGDRLTGWQLWPLAGQEHRDVNFKTNGFGDLEMKGGYDKLFLLWPVYFTATEDIGTDNPQKSWGALPLYMQSRSPMRDSTSVFWPFFSWIDDRGKPYREWQGPWPFVIFARGEGKTTSRVWPLFSRSHNADLVSDSYLWPVYTFKRTHSDPLDMKRTRFLVYVYQNFVQKNTASGADKQRLNVWPFFLHHHDYNGNRRLQILAPFEPMLPDNARIERNWSPLWSLWISECNPRGGTGSQSLLWNLYRRETAPGSKKCSLLFGLFQYQSDAEMKKMRLFYIPVFQVRPPAK